MGKHESLIKIVFRPAEKVTTNIHIQKKCNKKTRHCQDIPTHDCIKKNFIVFEGLLLYFFLV